MMNGTNQLSEKRKETGRLQGVVSSPLQLVIVAAMLVISCGCAIHEKNGTVRRYYLGYTVVRTPPTAPEVPEFIVRQVSNYGVAFGTGGTTAGYTGEKIVMLPVGGAIYLQVATDEQFLAAKQFATLCQSNSLHITKLKP